MKSSLSLAIDLELFYYGLIIGPKVIVLVVFPDLMASAFQRVFDRPEVIASLNYEP